MGRLGMTGIRGVFVGVGGVLFIMMLMFLEIGEVVDGAVLDGDDGEGMVLLDDLRIESQRFIILPLLSKTVSFINSPVEVMPRLKRVVKALNEGELMKLTVFDRRGNIMTL